MKDSTILILGAGQIGESCAILSLKKGPKKIVLHALTEEEAAQAVRNVRARLDGRLVDVRPSWGNALVTKSLMHTDDAGLRKPENRKKLLIYFYADLDDDLIKGSALYHVMEMWRPDHVFDCMNTATVIGYQDDPYSLPRTLLRGDCKHVPEDAVEELLVSSIVPAMVRFTQALKKSLIDFNVASYVKVSTTGLGGMGDNLLYTHGDASELGMSAGLLGKVAAAGVMHQLLLTLSHTPSMNVKVVVPAALVGWRDIAFGGLRSRGNNVPLVDTMVKMPLAHGKSLSPQPCHRLAAAMQMPYVDSGENSSYSLCEMTAITSPDQMGCVTREEVAQVSIAAALGDTRHDLLTAMDTAALGPSYQAGVRRRAVLDTLAALERECAIPSIATNNLGPTVSKHLFELHIMLTSCGRSLTSFVATPCGELRARARAFVETNQQARAQMLSLGLPILLADDEAIIGEHFLAPDAEEGHIISAENIDRWAARGWVDLREESVQRWQTIIKRLLAKKERSDAVEEISSEEDALNTENADIGEVLGRAYSLLGGNRKTERS